jgi:transcriptional regulator with XRE-family HTH domain
MNYGKGIRIARALAGVRQKQLAKLADVDPSHISLIEKGKREPSLDLLERLSSALGIPQDLLVLLSTEDKDLKLRNAKEIQRVAESIANLFFTYLPAQGTEHRGRGRPKQVAPVLNETPRSVARGSEGRNTRRK